MSIRREYNRGRLRQAMAATQDMPDALLELAPARWLDVVQLLPPGIVLEAICHPGGPNDDRLFGLTPALAAERAAELVALTDPRLREAFAARRVRLMTFAECFSGQDGPHEPA
jgi:hypothetical protein